MKRGVVYLPIFFSLFSVCEGAAPGDVDPSFNPGLSGSVSALCVQPDGKILVGGRFTNVNGMPCNGIARLNSDGSLDTNLFLGSTGTNSIFAIGTQTDGKIVVGGLFSSIAGTNRHCIARMNADGGLDSTFDPGSGVGGVHSYLQCVAVQTNGTILIAGSFSSVNGTPRSNVARLGANGGLDAGFAPVLDGPIESMAVQPDGNVIIGGQFSSVNGVTCNNIARLDSAGNPDVAFASNPGVGKDVMSLALLPDGKILIGGGMADSFYGTPFPGIARLSSDGTMDPGFDPGTGAGSIASIALAPGGKPVIGGSFTSVNGISRVRIARLDPQGTVDGTFDPGTGLTAACKPICPSVSAVAVQADGKVLAGGSFTNANGLPRKYLVRFFGSALPQFTAIAALADGQMSLSGVAATNAQLRLEASSNLIDWLPSCWLTNTHGVFHFTDSSATNVRSRFYRAAWLP